jgi:MoaA/NifB/PqqE/SkfB family radical SAM enzyme
MIAEKLKTVYYRGDICSCNYNCSYCPFHSRQSDLAADEAALHRFCGRAHDLGSGITIMLVPRGEALIHSYYHKAIASFCRYDNVSVVGCQTNLSFDVEEFAEHTAEFNSKISLWCSFHPSQTTLEDFLRQCELLRIHAIPFCAGAVGHPNNIPILRELRDKLPPDTYMWINAMKGLARDYTDREIETFSAIDPLFRLELEDNPADPQLCIGGKESIFIVGNGDYFSCIISKARLGNIYSQVNIERPKTCLSKKCDCYLAYANRYEMRGVFLSEKSLATRNPNLSMTLPASALASSSLDLAQNNLHNKC